MFREPTPEVDAAELLTGDTDPARIVSLALANGATRKVETTRRGVQQRSASASRWLSGDFGSEGHDRWVGTTPLGLSPQPGTSNGRDRAISPNRGFLIAASMDQRRSVSTDHGGGGNEARRLSPLNPSSSPPPPPLGLRQRYPSLSPSQSPLPTSAFPYQQLQKKRGLQGQEQLRELQKQYKFSEATLQRTLKAKQQLELSALYKRLLTIYPQTDIPPGASTKDGIVKRAYNPLMSIRNKKIRNRERIQLDLSSWEDPGAVEQWIEDVAVAVHEFPVNLHGGAPMLPPPPQPSGIITKQKRPRLDWVISPQELLAEFYWIEDSDRMRREGMHYNNELAEQPRGAGRTKGKSSQLSLKTLLEKEVKKPRGSFELARRKHSSRKLKDDLYAGDTAKKSPADVSKRHTKPKAHVEPHPFPKLGPEEYVYSTPPSSSEESGRSSESEMDSQDEDYSDMDADTSGAEEAKRKHHRRRRKLGQIITGGKRGKKVMKRRSDAYALDADERRKRQEIEEKEWIAEMGGRMIETVGRRSYSADEEYDSAAVGLGRNGHAPGLEKLGKTLTGVSLPTTLGGSYSSLEKYANGMVGRRSMDFGEAVVPSIAIKLSPPRTNARDEGYDTDGRGRVGQKGEGKDIGKRKMSPTKKLFERSQEAFVRVREGSLDRRRESVELTRTGSDKVKDKTKGRVKSRVEKIRNEVAKVEDFILRRDPGGSTAGSPTGSTFAESIDSRSDDDRSRLAQENTVSASEAEDEGRRGSKTWGRSSLEVPDGRRQKKYRGPHSMSYMPSIASPSLSKAKWKPKTGLLQDDTVGTDVDTDDDRRVPRGIYRLAPPSQGASREPSPARSVVFQSVEKKREDRLRPIAVDTVKKPPKTSTLVDEERTAVSPTAATHKPFATRRDLMMAKAYLTRSGVVARGITAKRARSTGAGGIVATAKEHTVSAAGVSRDIRMVEQVFVRKANYFTDSTVLGLRRTIDRIRADIEMGLMPMLASVSDGADALNEQLTTSCTLAVNGINDEAAAIARRKRRQMRWVRRGGYVLLEWAVLGVMWWVWLLVVVFNIVRGVFRVGVGTVRWVLWV